MAILVKETGQPIPEGLLSVTCPTNQVWSTLAVRKRKYSASSCCEDEVSFHLADVGLGSSQAIMEPFDGLEA